MMNTFVCYFKLGGNGKIICLSVTYIFIDDTRL